MSFSLEKLRLFYFSIRYTRLKQLLARLRLLIKRQALSRFYFATFKKRKALIRNSELELNESAPPLLFPARTQFLLSKSPLTLKFLNVEKQLSFPIDWRPEELQTGTRLWLLNLHYMEFLESVDDELFIELILDWIDFNIPYTSGYWLDNWNSYSLSIRVVVWMQQISLRNLSLSREVSQLIFGSLNAQLRFLSSNLELDIGGNHLIKNIKALLWGSKFFEGDEAQEWHKRAVDLLESELKEQILHDGMHYELSPAYHCQVFADLLECNQALDEGLCKIFLASTLEKMVLVIRDFTHPDNKISLFGDSGLNMTYTPVQCIEAYQKLFSSPMPLPTNIIDYPKAGYFGLRSDNELILIDAGDLAPDFLPAHGHGDALSFEWSIDKKRIIINPGVYEYNAGELRQYSRSTLSHNTVSLDNKDQSEFWHAFRVARRAKIIDRKVSFSENSISVDASHNGYKRLSGSPIHRRLYKVELGQVNITDAVIGGDKQQAVSRIMLHPDAEILVQSSTSAMIILSNIKLKLNSDRPIYVDSCWCFLDFGKRYQTQQICIDMGPAPCNVSFSLVKCD